MSDPQLLTLALQVLRHLFINVFEHGRGAWNLAAGEGAVLFGFFLRLDHFGLKFGTDYRVFLFGPLANADQVLLEAGNRVAQGKWLQSSAGRYFDGSSEVECGPAR